jgi:hypothetical protein
LIHKHSDFSALASSQMALKSGQVLGDAKSRSV